MGNFPKTSTNRLRPDFAALVAPAKFSYNKDLKRNRSMTVQITAVMFFIYSSIASAQQMYSLPSREIRVDLFKNFVSEIERIDGEGLIPRSNRSESWAATTEKLANEAAEARSLFDYGLVFKKLNATYPNLHANAYFHKELDRNKSEGVPQFDFKIVPDLVKRKNESYDYYIIPKDDKSGFKRGDKVIAINGVAIAKVEEDNFTFCKFPTKTQCASELHSNLSSELLNWRRPDALQIEIVRAGEKKIIEAAFKSEMNPKKSTGDSSNCVSEKSRYKDFVLDYKGFNLCGYVSAKHPTTMVLRIKSFRYGPNDDITDLKTEVEMFWFNYWRKMSGSVTEVIFDVIGNYGGASPIPYYALFSSWLFQEQYVQYKKIKELDRDDILDSVLWGENGKEIWLNNIKDEGIYDDTKEGDFFHPIPQFCAKSDKDCREFNFRPKKHKFSGTVKILTDQWCISSCVGFVYNMARLFKGKVKVYGHEDSGDSAYSRLTVTAMVIAGEKKIAIASLQKAKQPDTQELEPWIRQVVAVTRSTDKEGTILSGKPQKLDRWIPRTWNESDLEWSQKVFRAAIE